MQPVNNIVHFILSSRGGYVKYIVPLNITKYLGMEDEYIPWAAFENNIDYITSILSQSSPTYKHLKVCIERLTFLRFLGGDYMANFSPG